MAAAAVATATATATMDVVLAAPIPLMSSSAILKLLLLVVVLVTPLTYYLLALRTTKSSTCCSTTTAAEKYSRSSSSAAAASNDDEPHAQLPPGPFAWPVVGSLPEMLRKKPAFRWIHRWMREMGTDIACFKLGGVHVVSITCPELAREVLRKQDASFMSRPLTFASETFSGGYRNAVLSPYGDQWKKMRRVLTSEIICPSRHDWLHHRRADEADNLTRYVYYNSILLGAGAGAAVDVRHVARHYCGNVIRRLVFNRRYFGEPQPDGGPGPTEVLHMDAVFAALGILYAFCVSDYLPCLRGAGLDLDGHEKMTKEANDAVNRLHDTVVDDRWRQWKSGQRKERDDLLDVLIALQDAQGNPLLTIQEVKAQAKDITFAAVDNPSNAVEWALAEMLSNPAVMAKAVAELDSVVGRERLVQESDIPRLDYVKACIREAFRLHPVAPFNVPHVALHDTTLAAGRYRVPKGSHVILSRIGLGRNPRVWHQPLRFSPDRHLAAGGSGGVTLTENDLRFISFSTGRRGCVAATLGTAMTVMLFARLLQGFTWSKPPGVETVHLSESDSDTFMASPLLLHAKPRLPAHLYLAAAPAS